jgi:hypothetical protein
MFQKLHDELSKITWKYHKLEPVAEEAVSLKALSLDPSGVKEVMRIKEIVDRFLLQMDWDGENIRIVSMR